MNLRLTKSAARQSAGLARALFIGASLRISTELLGVSAVAALVPLVAAGMASAFRTRRRSRSEATLANLGIAAVGALALWRAEDVARAAASLGSGQPTAVGVLLGAGTFAMLRLPAARVGASRTRTGDLLGFAAGMLVARELALGGALTLALASTHAPEQASPEIPGWRRLLAGGGAFVATLALPAAAALDATLLGVLALGTGVAMGAGARTWLARGVAVTVLTTALAAALLRSGTLDAPLRGAFALFGMGLGVGALVGVGAPAPNALAALAALGLTPWLHSLLPDPLLAEVAQTRVASATPAGALATRRAESEILHAAVVPSRSVLRRNGENIALAEVDGVVWEPSGRAASAERFAATLARCVLPGGHPSVRIAGDAFGAVSVGAARQGFGRIDVATPDGELAAALGALARPLGRVWLSPGVRLLRVNDVLLARAGSTSDAVIEVLRGPWTSARQQLPSVRGLVATARTLAPGGVHVIVLPAARMDAGLLAEVGQRFAAAYPHASAWLPPDSADQLLLVGRPVDDDDDAAAARIGWEGMAACLDGDKVTLARAGVRTVEQLAALMTLDHASLAALPGARSPGPAMPASAWVRPEPPTALLAQPTSDPANVFAEGDALEATRALMGTRRAWLNLLAATREADPQAAFREAARVRALPGGAEVLTPLLRPHLERARAAMAEGARGGLGARAWNDAEASIATARMLLPEAADVRCAEGDLASARGQLPRAEDAYLASAKADPDALPGWEGLARVRRALGNPTGTEEALRSALVAQPGLWTASHNLGVFLLEAQRWDEAEPLLTQAAALAGRADKAVPAPTLALARLHLATDRPALALAEAERALQLEPGRPDGLAYRGAARLELGQLPMAETDFRAALDADPRSTMARAGLGQVHAARGEYDLAAAAFRAVIDQDPRNEAARENLRRLGPLLQERRAPAGRDARDLDRTVSPSPPR